MITQIPFFPLVKKDLTFIHFGNDSRVDGLVNFEKLRMVAKEVRQVTAMSRCDMSRCDPAARSSATVSPVLYQRHTGTLVVAISLWKWYCWSLVTLLSPFYHPPSEEICFQKCPFMGLRASVCYSAKLVEQCDRSVCLSVCLCLSVCVCLSVSVCLSVCLSVSHSLSRTTRKRMSTKHGRRGQGVTL